MSVVQLLFLGACLCFSCATSFTTGGPVSGRVGVRCSRTPLVLWQTPEEERAALLTAYLTKSHEEKLKTLRAVEAKKDAEIAALKEQLKTALPQSPTLPSPATEVGSNMDSLSKDELVHVVKSYQQFMAQYIDEAQEHKNSAVMAAEAAVAQKYEALLQQLKGGSPSATVASPAPTPDSTGSPADAPADAAPPAAKGGNLYRHRNAQVVAAASAGKSRWGDLEVARAIFLTKRANAGGTVNANGSSQTQSQVLPQVEVDGIVAGHTGGQAVNGAAGSPPSPSVPAQVSVDVNFQLRNARVAAAAKAGKSRWGEMEVLRIQSSVGRVSSGSGHAGAKVASPVAGSSPSTTDAEIPVNANFQLRNVRVAAAAKAGKSRWGDMEVLRIQRSVASASAQSCDAYKTFPAVSPSAKDSEVSVNANFQLRNARVAAAAKAGKSRWGELEVLRIQNSVAVDHGSQPDEGPALADRVNLGAQLLGK